MTAPTFALDIIGSATNDGIQITMPAAGTGAASLWLNNMNTGGHLYELGSNGTANSQGVGNFSIYDYTNALGGGPGTRFLLEGSTGNIGIGTTGPTAKLDVEETLIGGNPAGYFESSAATTLQKRWDQGVASGSSNYNMGGIFIGTGSGSSQSIGVWGLSSSNPSDWAGFFNGNVGTTGSFINVSDKKLKQDIKPLENMLEKIMLLKPSSYTFKNDEDLKDLNLPKGNQFGLIAQDLEQVFPELIKEVSELNAKGNKKNDIHSPAFKGVQYIPLIPVLISAIQEQQKMITDQTSINEKLQQQIDQLKQNGIGQTQNLQAQPASTLLTQLKQVSKCHKTNQTLLHMKQL